MMMALKIIAANTEPYTIRVGNFSITYLGRPLDTIETHILADLLDTSPIPTPSSPIKGVTSLHIQLIQPGNPTTETQKTHLIPSVWATLFSAFSNLKTLHIELPKGHYTTWEIHPCLAYRNPHQGTLTLKQSDIPWISRLPLAPVIDPLDIKKAVIDLYLEKKATKVPSHGLKALIYPRNKALYFQLTQAPSESLQKKLNNRKSTSTLALIEYATTLLKEEGLLETLLFITSDDAIRDWETDADAKTRGLHHILSIQNALKKTVPSSTFLSISGPLLLARGGTTKAATAVAHLAGLNRPGSIKRFFSPYIPQEYDPKTRHYLLKKGAAPHPKVLTKVVSESVQTLLGLPKAWAPRKWVGIPEAAPPSFNDLSPARFIAFLPDDIVRKVSRFTHHSNRIQQRARLHFRDWLIQQHEELNDIQSWLEESMLPAELHFQFDWVNLDRWLAFDALITLLNYKPEAAYTFTLLSTDSFKLIPSQFNQFLDMLQITMPFGFENKDILVSFAFEPARSNETRIKIHIRHSKIDISLQDFEIADLSHLSRLLKIIKPSKDTPVRLLLSPANHIKTADLEPLMTLPNSEKVDACDITLATLQLSALQAARSFKLEFDHAETALIVSDNRIEIRLKGPGDIVIPDLLSKLPHIPKMDRLNIQLDLHDTLGAIDNMQSFLNLCTEKDPNCTLTITHPELTLCLNYRKLSIEAKTAEKMEWALQLPLGYIGSFKEFRVTYPNRISPEIGAYLDSALSKRNYRYLELKINKDTLIYNHLDWAPDVKYTSYGSDLLSLWDKVMTWFKEAAGMTFGYGATLYDMITTQGAISFYDLEPGDPRLDPRHSRLLEFAENKLVTGILLFKKSPDTEQTQMLNRLVHMVCQLQRDLVLQTPDFELETSLKHFVFNQKRPFENPLNWKFLNRLKATISLLDIPVDITVSIPHPDAVLADMIGPCIVGLIGKSQDVRKAHTTTICYHTESFDENRVEVQHSRFDREGPSVRTTFEIHDSSAMMRHIMGALLPFLAKTPGQYEIRTITLPIWINLDRLLSAISENPGFAIHSADTSEKKPLHFKLTSGSNALHITKSDIYCKTDDMSETLPLTLNSYAPILEKMTGLGISPRLYVLGEIKAGNPIGSSEAITLVDMITTSFTNGLILKGETGEVVINKGRHHVRGHFLPEEYGYIQNFFKFHGRRISGALTDQTWVLDGRMDRRIEPGIFTLWEQAQRSIIAVPALPATLLLSITSEEAETIRHIWNRYEQKSLAEKILLGTPETVIRSVGAILMGTGRGLLSVVDGTNIRRRLPLLVEIIRSGALKDMRKVLPE